MRNTIFCSVPVYGYITEIYRDGPVYPPTALPVSAVRRMIKRGITVYEHDPKNPKTRIRLTENNYTVEDKFGIIAEKKHIAEAKAAEAKNTSAGTNIKADESSSSVVETTATVTDIPVTESETVTQPIPTTTDTSDSLSRKERRRREREAQRLASQAATVSTEVKTETAESSAE